MKTLIQKINTVVTLTAVFLLATVGLSAQTYEDDVYYSPSKNTSKKKATQPKDVKKEVKRTYRTPHKVESFSTAQKKYAKMLSKKEKESNCARAYNETESWIYNTQGLTSKQDIQKEISLYNKGNVNADNPNKKAYYEDEYVLWQPVKVTRIYTQPRWYSNFYFGFNFGWRSMYDHPFHYGYYNHYYWNNYYSYWGDPYYNHYYSPYYGYHRSYWRDYYYGYRGWRGYYAPYYNRNYYHPYYDSYGNYYNNRYYRNNYIYQKRPQEYSNNTQNTYRRNSVNSSDRNTGNAAAIQRVRAENMNRRYSSNAYRREITNDKHNLPNSGYRKAERNEHNNSSYRRDASTRRVAPKIANGSRDRDVMYQRENPYTRRIENTENSYRRNTVTTPRRSVENRNTQTYRRNTPIEYRRINSESSIRRNTSTTYRKTPPRNNNSGTYRRSTPSRSSNSSYRRSNSSNSNNSSYRRSTSTSRRSEPTYSSPSRNSSPSRSTPSRSNNNRYRR